MAHKGSKWKHRLIEKDTDKKIGVCSKCGEIDLRWNGRRYRCGNSMREQDKISNKKYYEKHFGNKGLICAKCGFVAESKVQMDIHHKDRVHKNNSPENLETLCANCHRLEHAEEMLNGFK